MPKDPKSRKTTAYEMISHNPIGCISPHLNPTNKSSILKGTYKIKENYRKLIYCLLGGPICYLPPFMGTRNNHWSTDFIKKTDYKLPSWWFQPIWKVLVKMKIKNVWNHHLASLCVACCHILTPQKLSFGASELCFADKGAPRFWEAPSTIHRFRGYIIMPVW